MQVFRVCPMPQMCNTLRFVVKLMNSGQQHIYDSNNSINITQLLNELNSYIKVDFNLDNNFTLQYENNSENEYITLENSDDIISRKFNSDYILIYIKPEYMYSVPEIMFYNKGHNRSRMAYLIKLDAAKKIQKFYRNIKQSIQIMECPCCYVTKNINAFNKYYICDHLLCNDCFNQWSQQSNTCPNCRSIQLNISITPNNSNENIVVVGPTVSDSVMYRIPIYSVENSIENTLGNINNFINYNSQIFDNLTTTYVDKYR